jgi:hypothetical protein
MAETCRPDVHGSASADLWAGEELLWVQEPAGLKAGGCTRGLSMLRG